MKKIFKVGSSTVLVAMLAFASTGCSIKQAKIDERTKAVAESSLLYDTNNEPIDFVTTYREYDNDYQEVKAGKNVKGTRTLTVIVSRDAKSRTYYFSHVETFQERGEEEVQTKYDIRQKLFVDSGVVKLETSDGIRNYVSVDEFTQTLIYSETYLPFTYRSDNEQTPYDAHFTTDYFKYSVEQYDLYKSAPLGGCSSDGNKALLPYIPNHVTYLNTVTCKAGKKLFGKDHTYKMNYRVSISEFDDLEVKLSADNKLVSAHRSGTKGISNGTNLVETTDFNVSFENVD